MSEKKQVLYIRVLIVVFIAISAMLAGLIIVPVVSIFTKKPDKSVVDKAFECYKDK